MDEPLRILLVEDSEDDASLLLREIKKGGYEPTLVRVETAEAMATCLNEHTWDIVISDYSLPNFSVSEALKVLQKSGLDLPFIIVSGKVADEVAVAALTAGAHDFVRKDNMVRLIPAIKRELAEAIGRAEYEKAQIELKESESLLRAISANFPNSYISIIEEDFTLGFTSGKEFKMKNLDPESFVGLTLEEVFGEQTPFIKEHYLKVFDGAETSFELFINEQYQEYNVVPLFDENGEVHRILSVVENITERKQVEEALRASEEKYRQLIDLAQEGIWVIDKDANTSFVNPSMAEMLGYTADEMQGKHLFSFMDECGVEIATRNLERRQQGIKEQHDFEFLRKEGTRIYTTLETAPITDEAGNYLGAIAGVIDITERKRAEDALMESEEKYSSLFKNNNSVMLLIDPETGNIVDANPSACSFYGYSQTELIQKNIYKINLLSEEEIQQEMNKAKLEQRNHFFFKHRLASGKIRDVEVYSAPITVQGKSLLYSIIHDITERKQAEEALRDSELKYRSLFENSIQGVGISQGNQVIDANKPLLEIFGYDDLEKFLAVPLLDHVAPESKELIMDIIEKRASGMLLPTSYEYKILRKDGEIRDLEISTSIFKIGDEKYVQSTFSDITERKQAEEVLRKSEDKYRSLFESMAQGVFYQLANGSLIDVNQAALNMLGLTRDQFLGRDSYDPAWKVISEDGSDLPPDKHPSMVALKTGKDVRDVVVGVFNPKTNEYNWLNINAKPQFRDGEKKPYQVFVTLHDITKLKHAEEALQAREHRLLRAQEVLHVGDWENDLETDRITWSDELYRIYGFEPADELKLETVIAGMHPDDRDHVKEMLASWAENGEGEPFEYRVLRPDGSIRHVYSPTDVVCDSTGKVVKLYGVSLDVTERKQAEETLRLHSEMLENMGEGVYLIRTSDGIIVYANPRFEEMFGYEPGEMIGQHVSIVNAPTDISPEEKVRVLMKILMEEGAWHGDIQNIKKDGTPFWCHANVSVFEHSEYGQVLVAVHEDITERKQTEENLRESKQFIESIVNLIPEIVYIYDIIEQKNVYSNDGIQKILGYSVDEVQEMGNQVVSTLMHPDDFKTYLEETYPRYSKAKDDEIISHQYRMKHKNSQWYWLDCSESIYMRQSDGSPKQIFGVIHDITEHKHSEEALAKYTNELELNKNRLDVLLQLTRMTDRSLEEISSFVLEEGAKLTNSEFGFIGLMDEDESILSSSAWTKKVMDVCCVIDKPLRFIVDGAGVWIEPILQRKSVIINDYESTELNKNGVPEGHIPLKRLINVPIFEGDKIVALVAMANKEDEYDENDVVQLTLLLEGMWSIIQRKHAEDEKDTLIHEISKRTKELNLLYDISKLAAKTGITWENVMEQAIIIIPTGWQYPEITCARIILNGNEYATSNFAKTMWRQIAPIIISDELVGSVEVCYLEEMPKIDEGPFYHEERDLINTVAKQLGSITERKKAEDEILRLNSELEQRVKDRTAELEQKNKELVRLDKIKTEFLDTVNHELRTPLTSIIGYSRLLLDGVQGEMTEKQTNYIERIWARGNHQLQLVNDLLDFSKLESGNMDFMSKSVSVTAAINDTVHDEMPLLKEKGQEVILEIADDVADVYVDEMRLKQVLLNLINNAIKFTPDNGKIVIKADNVDKMVKISIIDNGIGIKETDMGQLFKKFVQIDQSDSRSFGGTGLGLTIAKDMVELMGGHIDVESEYGKGSTFSIFLPQKDSGKADV